MWLYSLNLAIDINNSYFRMIKCPLCSNNNSFIEVDGPDKRVYYKCNSCKLIFSDPSFYPSEEEERKRYLTHNNGIEYPGYVTFLNQAIHPALPYLKKGMQGLDFGCGPVPTLSVLLKREGYACEDYDPIFFPKLPHKKFDFIFATECFEHFFNPKKEINTIKSLLKPNGFLIVMTQNWETENAFSSWNYADDITHVCFYHQDTFDYISKTYKLQFLENANDRVFILKNLL